MGQPPPLPPLKRREAPAASREDDKMIITPLGAGNEVGRSCVHMTFKGKTVLVCCHSHNCVIIFSQYRIYNWCFHSPDFDFFLVSCICGCVVAFVWIVVWLWYSPRLFGHGCFALLWWDWSVHNWCPSRNPVCIYRQLMYKIWSFCWNLLLKYIRDDTLGQENS